MASGGDIHSILYRGDPLKESFEPRFDPSKKVKRYFPGQVPSFESGGESADEAKRERIVELVVEASSRPAKRAAPAAADRSEQPTSDTGEEEPQGDKSLEEARRVKRRSARELVELQPTPEAVSKDDTQTMVVAPQKDETPAERRERLRRAALERQKQEEEELVNVKQELAESEEDDESSDEMSDGSEEDEAMLLGLRPVFIPAAKRECVKEDEEAEEAEKMVQAQKEEQLRARREDSKRMLISTIEKEEEEERIRNSKPPEVIGEPTELPDDEDGKDEEAEYELWKIRELKRIKRDKEEAEAHRAFLEEVERRRNMSEAERSESDRLLDAQKVDVKKGKYVFLQKYYHRGAFFQDLAQSGQEPLYLRDVNQSVGEDAVDKKTLPRPMQLRRGQFGKAGRVKHTHLVDVDTTDFTSAWAQRNATEKKMAGLKGANQLERPTKKEAASEKHHRRYT